MNITKFKIKNFRSIKGSYTLPLDSLTILIGPNNEGKSNIMYALTHTLNQFSYFCNRKSRDGYKFFNSKNIILDYDNEFKPLHKARNKNYESATNYEWKRDYPLDMQKDNKGGTEFFVEFYFSKSEIKNFQKYTGYILKSKFGIKLYYDTDSHTYIVPCDGGRRIARLDNQNGFISIGKLFNNKWNFQYIPTIRTPEMTISIVDKMIEKELAILDDDKIYSDLIKKIEELQKPILDNFSEKLTKDMKQYLSNIKSVRLISKNRIQKLARQASQIYIDDGANTLIDMKGDGVKSLLAISVLHNAVRNKEKSDLFIGIEEPESHLHPKAIHRLKDVIYELAKNNQIIISTHSPIFVDRQNIKNNIIVNSKTASPAKNINEIRDSLGVLISDNLQSAGHVLLVEGEGDVRCIKTFLNGNKITKRALSKGELMIKALVGVSNLSYQLKHYQEVLCKVYVFIDNDDEGRAAYQKASELNLISTKDIFFTNFPGRSNSEFEDLIMPSIYKDAVYQELGILLQGDKFQDYRSKWSDRVKNVYHGSGKPWNEGIKAEIKNIVCTQIERMGISALLKQGEAPILSLINHLKNQLKTTT